MSAWFSIATATATEAQADCLLLRDLHNQKNILRTKEQWNTNEQNVKKQQCREQQDFI
jgi:hypothetical protein